MYRFFKIRIPKKKYKISTRKKKHNEDDKIFARQMQEIADMSAAKSMNKKLNNNSKKKEIIANRLNNYDNRVPKSLIKDMFNKDRNVEKLIKDLKVMGFLKPKAAAAATPKTSYLVNHLNKGLGKSRKKLKK